MSLSKPKTKNCVEEKKVDTVASRSKVAKNLENMSMKTRKRFKGVTSSGKTVVFSYVAAPPQAARSRPQRRMKRGAKIMKGRGAAIANSDSSGGPVSLGFVFADRSRNLECGDIENLQDTIVDLMLDNNTPTRPQFKECLDRSWWWQLVCANVATADWIRSQFPSIAQNSKLHIVLLEEDQFPKHIIAGHFVQHCKSSEDMLALISSQNYLDTKLWRVLGEYGFGKETMEVIFAIDDSSMHAIAVSNGYISYGFGRMRLLPRNGTDSEPNEDTSLDFPSPSNFSMWHKIIEALLQNETEACVQQLDSSSGDPY